MIDSSFSLEELQAVVADEKLFKDDDIQIPSLPGAPEVMSRISGPNLWLLLICFCFVFLGGKWLSCTVSGALSISGNPEYLLSIQSVFVPVLDIEGTGNLR